MNQELKAIIKQADYDQFQDGYQAIEHDAEQLVNAMSEPLPNEMHIVINGEAYPLPTWSADVQHILDTAMKSIAIFAKSQYKA